MYTMTSGSVKFCLEIINNYYYIMIFSKIIASNFLQGYRPQHSRRIHACDKFSQYIIFTALFVLLMQVCGTKVISAGSFSGTCSAVLFQPLDLVKTRLQLLRKSQLSNRSIVGVAYSVLREEKVFGLWTGLVPVCL